MGADRGNESSSRAQVSARGIFYTAMADVNLRPADFAASLQHAARFEYIERPSGNSVIHAEIALSPDDGAGYFGLTRIGSGLLVIVDDYCLQKPRVELIQDGGLIQFDFKLSGDVALVASGSRTVHLDRPGLFIAAHPRGSISTRLTVSHSRERGVTLVLTPRFLQDGFLNPCAPAGSWAHEWASPPVARSSTHRVPLSAMMFEIVGHLLGSRYSGKLSLVYTEGLALELLCATVSELLTRWPNRSSAVSRPAARPRARDASNAWMSGLTDSTTRH